MKILVYSDVHGNKYALEELQKTQDYRTADLRIFLGDAVAMCPYPNECIEMIMNNNDVFLLGNHDSYCAYGLPKEEYPFFKEDKRQHQKYMRNKTFNSLKNKLKTIPKEYYVKHNGLNFYFTHYAWETDRLVMDDPDEPNCPTKNTARLFDNIKADYIIFGHNHKPNKFENNNKTFVCCGSLGMKYPGNYVLIETENKNVDIQHKQIDYNVKQLQNEMLQENYPRANKYATWFNE